MNYTAKHTQMQSPKTKKINDGFVAARYSLMSITKDELQASLLDQMIYLQSARCDYPIRYSEEELNNYKSLESSQTLTTAFYGWMTIKVSDIIKSAGLQASINTVLRHMHQLARDGFLSVQKFKGDKSLSWRVNLHKLYAVLESNSLVMSGREKFVGPIFGQFKAHDQLVAKLDQERLKDEKFDRLYNFFFTDFNVKMTTKNEFQCQNDNELRGTYNVFVLKEVKEEKQTETQKTDSNINQNNGCYALSFEEQKQQQGDNKMKDHLTGEESTDTLAQCENEGTSNGSWINKEIVNVEICGGYVITTTLINGRLIKTRVPATQEQASKGNVVKFEIKGKDIKPAAKLAPTKATPYLIETRDGEEHAVPYNEYQAMCAAVCQFTGKNPAALNFFQKKEIKAFVGRVLADNQKYHTTDAFENLLIEYSKTLKNGWGFYLGQLDSWFGQKKEGKQGSSSSKFYEGDIDVLASMGLK